MHTYCPTFQAEVIAGPSGGGAGTPSGALQVAAARQRTANILTLNVIYALRAHWAMGPVCVLHCTARTSCYIMDRAARVDPIAEGRADSDLKYVWNLGRLWLLAKESRTPWECEIETVRSLRAGSCSYASTDK